MRLRSLDKSYNYPRFSRSLHNSMLRLIYRPTCSQFGKQLAPAPIRKDWIRIERVRRQIARMGLHSQILLKDIPYTVCISSQQLLYHIYRQHRLSRQWSIHQLISSLQFKDPSIIDNRCFVGGKWISASSGKTFAVLGTPILPSHLSQPHT